MTSLQKHGIPPALGAGIVLLLLLTLLGLGIYTLTGQVERHHRPGAGRGEPAARPDAAAARPVGRGRRKGAARRTGSRQDGDSGDAARRRRRRGANVHEGRGRQPAFSLSNYLWSGSMTLLSFLGQFVLVLFLVYFFLSPAISTSGSW